MEQQSAGQVSPGEYTAAQPARRWTITPQSPILDEEVASAMPPLLEAAPDAFVIVDQNGLIVITNGQTGGCSATIEAH
jgi:hypothetical protein